MELRDGELLLRPFAESDVPAVFRACQDPDIAHFIPHMPVPYTEQDAAEYVALTQTWLTEGNRCALAILDSGSGELLGSVDVRLGEVGSIGYWVAPWARNRGVATRALALLSRWAIRERGVERLELLADVENVASQRVAEKAGFQREGVLRSHLRFSEGRRDSVIFSLLPSDLD